MISINEFIEKVKETLEVSDDNITAETGIRDFPNWNSMNALILIAMFETEFDTTLTGDDLRSCNTMGDLYNVLVTKN
jgi:acyl carrier protein